MYYFHNMPSALGLNFALDSHRDSAPVPCWGTCVQKTVNFFHPEKILRAPMIVTSGLCTEWDALIS